MLDNDQQLSWVETALDYLPEIAIAVAVLIVFNYIGKLVRNIVKRLVWKTTDQHTVVSLAGTFSYIVLQIIGAIIALRVLNLDGVVTSVLAGAGIVGLALGFAFQDIASNFIAGVVISVQKKFNIGDLIEIDGTYGTIQDIDLRVTTLQTLQGQTVFVPNKDLFTTKVADYTNLGRRRIDLAVGVSYGDDLEKVKKVAAEAIGDLKVLSSDYPLKVYFTEYADSSINLELQYWIDFQGEPDFLEARSQGIVALKKAFDKNGISIPFPIRTLNFDVKGGSQLHEQLKK